MTVKTILAGLGIALLSACSGNVTGPSAAPVDRSGIKAPVERSNFSGYVVAERDSSGGGLIMMGQQIMRRIPATDSLSLGSLQ